jgi:OTU domain-containing protein 5
MEYMLCEKEYFQPFIEGNMSDFMSYLEHKLQNGVWGDDPEIQAICEIYNRPAEIWCFDPVEGARKMRTFHEGGGGNQTSHRAPMRLSYYGGGHYDSVYSLTNFQPLVNTPPGIEENERILLAQQRCDTGMLEETKEQSDVLATEQEELSLALQTSREACERLDDDLDVLFQHQTNMVLAANDTEQTTQDMLRGAEEHEVNQALQLSQVQDDTDDLQRALAMSAEGDMTVDPELQHALQISQQQPTNDLDAAIALSLNSHDGGGFPAALYDEDDELQRAIEMSHRFG